MGMPPGAFVEKHHATPNNTWRLDRLHLCSPLQTGVIKDLQRICSEVAHDGVVTPCSDCHGHCGRPTVGSTAPLTNAGHNVKSKLARPRGSVKCFTQGNGAFLALTGVRRSGSGSPSGHGWCAWSSDSLLSTTFAGARRRSRRLHSAPHRNP